MFPRKNKGKREAWTLLPDCGHLVLAEPTAGALSPTNRTLEVLLGQGKDSDSCPCCDNPANSPMTIRNNIFMSNELRKHCYAQVQNLDLSEKARITAGEEAVGWSLDTRYLEGIVEGAKAKPIYSIIYENHFLNEHAEWKAKKVEVGRARKAAIAQGLLPEPMKKLELMLTKLRHHIDCTFAFAQGKLLGQRWAEARGEAIPSAQLGPDHKVKLELDERNEQTRRRSSAVGLAITRRLRFHWSFYTGHRRESRIRYQRRLLVRLVRMEEQSVEETEQIALPVNVV
ncbi:hypothetical protein DL98DRAFT_528634 [Cadophora sp. DSE1049]|nr:hypothetical protein DL98DRAFT_528634 [Cadophora sp. DSE1049]